MPNGLWGAQVAPPPPTTTGPGGGILVVSKNPPDDVVPPGAAVGGSHSGSGAGKVKLLGSLNGGMGHSGSVPSVNNPMAHLIHRESKALDHLGPTQIRQMAGTEHPHRTGGVGGGGAMGGGGGGPMSAIEMISTPYATSAMAASGMAPGASVGALSVVQNPLSSGATYGGGGAWAVTNPMMNPSFTATNPIGGATALSPSAAAAAVAPTPLSNYSFGAPGSQFFAAPASAAPPSYSFLPSPNAASIAPLSPHVSPYVPYKPQ